MELKRAGFRPGGVLFLLIVVVGILVLRSRIKRSGSLGRAVVLASDWYNGIRLFAFLVIFVVIFLMLKAASDDNKKKKK